MHRITWKERNDKFSNKHKQLQYEKIAQQLIKMGSYDGKFLLKVQNIDTKFALNSIVKIASIK